MNKYNLRISVVFLLLGILLLIVTPYCTPAYSSAAHTLESDFFPTFTGWFTIVCSVGLFISTRIDMLRGRESEEYESRDKIKELKVLIIFVMLVAYTALCGVIGFLLASIVFVCSFMAVLNVRTWWYYAISIVSVCLIFYCFRYLLYIHLPLLGIWYI